MPAPPRRRKLRVPGARVRAMVARKLRRTFNPQPTFTETFAMPTIVGNTGGVFRVQINNIPQLAQYSALYNQYKINTLKVMILPDYNSYDGSQPLGGTTLPRISYAINDTPDVTAPLSEADVLSDNGVRVRSMSTKLTIRCNPKPQRPNATLGVEVIDAKSPFFTFATPGQTNPIYTGISYWIAHATAGGQPAANFQVYYKVTFTLRDPK